MNIEIMRRALSNHTWSDTLTYEFRNDDYDLYLKGKNGELLLEGMEVADLVPIMFSKWLEYHDEQENMNAFVKMFTGKTVKEWFADKDNKSSEKEQDDEQK